MAIQMREVRLPEELCEAAEKRFGERFDGLEAFLVAALKELLRDEAKQMDENEQRMIEERLKDLGYI